MALAHDRTFPVVDELSGLFADRGIRRGSTIGVTGDAAVSLAVALTIGVARSGGWVVAVGLPFVGSMAASELGAELSRWAFIDRPGNQAGDVVHALATSVDLILVGPDIKLRADHGRKIVARMRERGTSVIAVGNPRPFHSRADVSLRIKRAAWTGIGSGHGRLISRRVEVEAMGRGANASPRRQLLWLPDGKGRLSIIDQSDGVKNSSRLIRAENKKVFSELTEPALRAS
ncbi:MAG: hypothetical protein CL434_10310 [Acidimicrobiaceae bacterium]|nr:hypothetical protein [Acidimicrobiaceae bacterium]